MRGPGSTLYGRPDWVVAGFPWMDGQVAVLASRSLSHAELAARVETESIYLDVLLREHIPLSTRYTLTVVMTDFVMCVAPDYPSAFAALFEEWTPQRAGGLPAIAPPAPEIGR